MLDLPTSPNAPLILMGMTEEGQAFSSLCEWISANHRQEGGECRRNSVNTRFRVDTGEHAGPAQHPSGAVPADRALRTFSADVPVRTGAPNLSSFRYCLPPRCIGPSEPSNSAP
ncbi:hypothetical protein Pla52o_14500 [Novipirellula galeiformis]|uniref:Uncharacterized protein n=1 Tax=Novipirellula galeiformis TaxID=2528004 RepID=A0A5C6CL92_9BACT|nr:hypothetical protein Pla52o_14500 [Novipirellula galeiformis]